MSLDTTLRISNLLKAAHNDLSGISQQAMKRRSSALASEAQVYNVSKVPTETLIKSFCTSNMTPAEKLQCLYDRDKFINGAVVAAKCQNYGCKKVMAIISKIFDRNLSENAVRVVWDYWKRFNKIYFTKATKRCIFTKQEASLLYQNVAQTKDQQPLASSTTDIIKPLPEIPDSIPQPLPSTQNPQIVLPKPTVLPFLRNVLMKNSQTTQIQVTYVPIEEAKCIVTKETFKTIREVIKSNKRKQEPNWVNVSIKMMISASQFQVKHNIEFQCFQKLKEVVFFRCIQWIGVVLGETLTGRGKFIYLHCKYDKNIIKRKRHLRAFLLEQIPQCFFSHNSLNAHKVQIMGFEKFLKAYQIVNKVEYPKKFH